MINTILMMKIIEKTEKLIAFMENILKQKIYQLSMINQEFSAWQIYKEKDILIIAHFI